MSGSGRAGVLVHVLLVAAGLASLGALSRVDFLLFHSVVELVAVGVAWGVFFVAWNARRFAATGFFTVLGCAYFHVGALDLLHTLSYDGMGLAHDGGNTATQLWMAARLVEATMLVGAFAYVRRPAPAGAIQAGLTVVSAALVTAIAVLGWFPDCFVPGQGLTTFKIAGEYVVIALFAAGAALTVAHRHTFDPDLSHGLLGFFVLRILSELAFTTYGTVFDDANMAGHLLKAAGFYLFYRATIGATLSRPYQMLFQDLGAAREALRFAEERFRLAIRPAPVLAFSQDLALRYDWVFAGAALPGRLPAVGGTDEDFLLPDDAAALKALKRGVIETGLGLRREVRLGKRRRRAYDLTIAPLRDADGAVVGIVGTAIEVTELVKARAEAERANQAKSRFLAAASHDLRQPFQAMRLFHHALSERVADAKGRVLADKLGEAMAGGEDLLHALLDVSTLEAGMLHPKIEAFPVGTLLQQIGSEFEPQAARKGLRLRVVPSRAVARSDPALLGRMLRNLATNALRYTESGGIVIGCRRKGDALDLMVCDTGIGIASEQLDAIFDDFYQVGNPERDRGKGLGLGLSVVMRVGRLLGHPVAVRSQPGRGSCFSVRVPLAAARDRDRLAFLAAHHH